MNFRRHTQIYRSRNRQPLLVQTISYPVRAHTRIQPPPRKKPNYKVVTASLVVVIMLGAVMALWPSGSAPKTQGQQATVQAPEPVKQLDYQPMSEAINAAIKAVPSMDVGVAVVDMKTGDTLKYGVEVPFVAASTAKLLTAIAYLHDTEQGKLSLDQMVGNRTAQAALEALIVNSDNQAWYDLNNVVMSHAELAAYANQIGFVGYDPDSNTVLPASLATMLSNLYQRRLLNEQHTQLLLSYMQRAKEVEYVTSIVPAGIKVFHKPGYLADRVHDALIVDNGQRPYALVIFSKSRTSTYDGTAGINLFQTVSKATFQTFL